MGRTKRSRRRLQRSSSQYTSHDLTCIILMKWLRNQHWIPSCELQPVVFKDFGRGLMTKKLIEKGKVIFSIPYNLLITSSTVEDSPIACIFQCSHKLYAQDVLSLYLVWEKQCGEQSRWVNYIKSLPSHFSLPLFCSDDEFILLPSFVLQAVKYQKEKILNSFNCISKALEMIQNNPNYNFQSKIGIMDFKYEDFLWAWSVVNSRSVYCENKPLKKASINVVDKHCLALAPLLDMFNHSNDSDLKAELTTDGLYQIVATSNIPRYSQVFIHYGHHSNLHLYVEYGFVMLNNVYDSLFLSVEDISNTVKLLLPLHYSYSQIKNKFISSHNLDRDLYISAEGLSFNAKALIFLFSTPECEKWTFSKTIYCNSYSKQEALFIKRVSLKLMDIKILELTEMHEKMNSKCEGTSESFVMAKCLIREFLNILGKAKCYCDAL